MILVVSLIEYCAFIYDFISFINKYLN